MKKFICALLAALMALSLAACGPDTTDPTNDPTNGDSQPPKVLTMAEMYETITSGVTMPEMLLLDADMMLDLMGVKAEHCTQSVIYICGDGLRTDEIWLIEAADEAALAGLKSLVTARLDAKAAESETYSPEQYAIVQKAQVIENGLYLAVLVSPEVDTLAANYKSAAGIN